MAAAVSRMQTTRVSTARNLAGSNAKLQMHDTLTGRLQASKDDVAITGQCGIDHMVWSMQTTIHRSSSGG